MSGPSGFPRATCQAPGAEQGPGPDLGGPRNWWVMDELTFESDYGLTWAALRGQFWIKPRSLAQDCCGVSKEAKGLGAWSRDRGQALGLLAHSISEKTLDGGTPTWKTGA